MTRKTTHWIYIFGTLFSYVNTDWWLLFFFIFEMDRMVQYMHVHKCLKKGRVVHYGSFVFAGLCANSYRHMESEKGIKGGRFLSRHLSLISTPTDGDVLAEVLFSLLPSSRSRLDETNSSKIQSLSTFFPWKQHEQYIFQKDAVLVIH